MTIDPIQNAEEIVKNVHDASSRYTKPTLQRYPLTFGFLVIFSVAAILHGFELFTDEFVFFKEYPSVLILGGIIVLLLTGRLYKSIKEHEIL